MALLPFLPSRVQPIVCGSSHIPVRALELMRAFDPKRDMNGDLVTVEFAIGEMVASKFPSIAERICRGKLSRHTFVIPVTDYDIAAIDLNLAYLATRVRKHANEEGLSSMVEELGVNSPRLYPQLGITVEEDPDARD